MMIRLLQFALKMLDKVRRQDMIVESFDDIEYDYLAPIDHL